MKSTKCVQCGFVYWLSEPKCKRCGAAAPEGPALDRNPTPPSYPAPPPRASMSPGEDAMRPKLLKSLKGDSYFFYLVGGLQIILSFLKGNLLFVDGIINITLSFLVHKFRSRVAAIFLLSFSILGAIFGFATIAFLGLRPGIFYPLALVLRVLTSARMVYATFKLNGYVEENPALRLPPPPPDLHAGEPQWTVNNTSAQWQPSETN